jgi:[ribosomal protein S5]-alanine N-acetyltransferase
VSSEQIVEGIVEPIRTPRLSLVSMSVPFMQALARGDLLAGSREIGASVPAWLAGQLEHFLQFRLAQLAVDPTIRPWLGRAIVLDDEHGDRHVIGSVGFHGPPDNERRLEIGYSIDPPYRRQGFAREAVRAMFDWARAIHGVNRFVASVSPDNEASLNLIEQFGFEKVGEQIDDVDGLEYVFETTWPKPTLGRPT